MYVKTFEENIRGFNQLKAMLAQRPGKNRLAVAAAQDQHVLEAVMKAADEGLIEPILIGDEGKIRSILGKIPHSAPDPQIIQEPDDNQAAIKAALLARNGEVECIMKGKMDTSVLMRVLVGREYGIRVSDTMSMLAFMESPYYHKVFVITDVGLLLRPTLEQKKAEIENAVAAFHKLGVTCPKVAILAAVEKVNPKMSETLDAEALKNMNIPGCVVEGPISYDLAMDPQAAAIKGYQSEVAGDADILLVPDIVSGNVAAKTLTCCGGARTCGTVLGAKIPIVMSSRSASADDKYMSIVLSMLIS